MRGLSCLPFSEAFLAASIMWSSTSSCSVAARSVAEAGARVLNCTEQWCGRNCSRLERHVTTAAPRGRCLLLTVARLSSNGRRRISVVGPLSLNYPAHAERGGLGVGIGLHGFGPACRVEYRDTLFGQ